MYARISDAVCATVGVCVSFARKVGVCFELRCLHGSFLPYISSIDEIVIQKHQNNSS